MFQTTKLQITSNIIHYENDRTTLLSNFSIDLRDSIGLTINNPMFYFLQCNFASSQRFLNPYHLWTFWCLVFLHVIWLVRLLLYQLLEQYLKQFFWFSSLFLMNWRCTLICLVRECCVVFRVLGSGFRP